MSSSSNKAIIVGLLGQAESGKSEAAKIATKFFYNAYHHPKIIPIAHPLKIEAAQAYGYGNDWKRFKAEKPEEYRTYCVKHGQEKREADPHHWINRWKDSFEEFTNRPTVFPKVVLVDDVRFQNEVDILSSMNAILVYIDGSSRIKDAPFRHEEPEMLANNLAKVFPYRTKKEKDAWSQFGQDKGIQFCIDNNKSLARLSLRVSELVLGWTAPVDVVLSINNPFLYSYMRDYQIAYSTLSNEHKKEVSSCGFDDDLVHRYATRQATRPNRA